MARDTTKVRTDRPAEEVFAYLADLRGVAGWDPGVRRVEQVEADGTGTVVTYDAALRRCGLLRLGDLGPRLVFGRLGDRAAAVLRRALDGERAG